MYKVGTEELLSGFTLLGEVCREERFQQAAGMTLAGSIKTAEKLCKLIANGWIKAADPRKRSTVP